MNPEEQRMMDYIIAQADPKREREDADVAMLTARLASITKPYEKEAAPC